MTDTPLTRAARALGEVYDGSADPDETPNNWARAQAGVRAVLEATREPSEGMTDAAENSDSDIWSPEPGEGLEFIYWEKAWKAMIDAALSE